MRVVKPMPALFFGHGSPMNAIQRNAYTEAWAAIGARLPRPAAVLAISAHWYIPGVSVTAMPVPKTIHDFAGFSEELYRVRYPAPGDSILARRVQTLAAPLPVELDQQWGLDHGTWSVLSHVFPKADIPVVQLSIDERQPPAFHYEFGKRLAPLRDEGVLIMGSGNVVHNLFVSRSSGHAGRPYEWAVSFENRVRDFLLAGDDASLVAYDTLGRDAMQSVPTPEHFLPLLYVTALRRKGENVTFPVEGVDRRSVSMLTMEIA